MVKLKPCPFCGGKDSGILTTSYDGYWFAVFCENCMAQTRKCRQEKDAVEAWNRRIVLSVRLYKSIDWDKYTLIFVGR